MIGQDNLKIQINKLISSDFPRFIIITGPKGQGKKTISNYISNQLKYPLISIDIKIDSIREMINMAYKQTEPIIYLIPDADKMSIGAKNSLLKVIEEPPNNAYFIITLQSIENTLPTIKSRCQELKMDSYNITELTSFIDNLNPNISDLDKCTLIDICQNKYEIELLLKYGISDFYNFVAKVVHNIYRVQSANSFKIEEKLNLKDDDSKYNLDLFLRTFKNICMDKIIKLIDDDTYGEYKIYVKCIEVTSNIQNKLTISGINKQSLIDMWILDIRKIWRNSQYEE